VAYEFYVKIQGKKQGQFKGESTRAGHSDRLVGIAFSFEVDAPRDIATGQASGKRQHKPVLFVKEWGAASPQLYQAATTNEVLSSVVFEFVTTSADGEERVAETVTLTDATISKLKRTADARSEFADHGHPTLDEVEFTFQKIEFQSNTKPGRITRPEVIPR
jgi:type VI secretion system secreted protein Hcp